MRTKRPGWPRAFGETFLSRFGLRARSSSPRHEATRWSHAPWPPSPSSANASMGRTLRLVSYNVRYFGHALKGLASTRGAKRVIASRLVDLDPRPDLICLQEVETISL